ncbi:hypothetical protein MKK64_17335 [Methylobacterium sp. E-025]|uniref:hypothetical protein n=1 Tax=Methylobacterium sp. E-025 TaxID=2836561 RepID=UPI001FB9F323|nr:hypothetical protein [Methylobacterium sp. E-025]MCJ2112947.1 hypothetical protein [Methylobacterium sp. E-025]
MSKPCLHCALLDAVQAHAVAVDAADPKPDGPAIVADDVIRAIGELAAQVIASAPADTEKMALFTLLQRAVVGTLQQNGVSASIAVVNTGEPAAERMH